MKNNKEKVKEELWCEALKSGHTMKYRALGHSMSPFIKSGSILTVKPDKRMDIGDVILSKSCDSLFAHRIIAKKYVNGEAVFVTKGDNLSDRDPEVNYQNILGKVIEIEYDGKTVCMPSSQRRMANYLIAVMSGPPLSLVLFVLRKMLSFKDHAGRIIGRVINVS